MELSHSSNSPKHQTICIDKSVVECIPNGHPEILGKCARMRFDNEEGQEEWYEGVISSYNMITGKYGIYFPCDGLSEEASFDDDLQIMD